MVVEVTATCFDVPDTVPTPALIDKLVPFCTSHVSVACPPPIGNVGFVATNFAITGTASATLEDELLDELTLELADELELELLEDDELIEDVDEDTDEEELDDTELELLFELTLLLELLDTIDELLIEAAEVDELAAAVPFVGFSVSPPPQAAITKRLIARKTLRHVFMLILIVVSPLQNTQ